MGYGGGELTTLRFLLAFLAIGLCFLPWYEAGGAALVLANKPWLYPIVLLSLGILWKPLPFSGAALFYLLAQAFFIGMRGWNYPALTAFFGALPFRQFGLGSGAALTFVSLLFIFALSLAKKGNFGGDKAISLLVLSLIALIGLFTLWPILTILSQAFIPSQGEGFWQSLGSRFFHPKIWGLACIATKASCGAAWNTLALGFSTAFAATTLGLAFALLVTRTNFRFTKALRLLTILPIITPPFIIGLGLILIFGRSGLVNLSLQSMFGFDMGRFIYGFNGVWLAQVFSFTPTAFLVLIGVVEGLSPTLEEASETLRANATRTFNAVTFPLMKPGLLNAFLVVFIESLADFGNPLVLGGSFGVLSTEIFFAIVGAQADFGRAAMLAFILLSFALALFAVQRRLMGRQSYVSLSGKGDAGLKRELPLWVKRLAALIAIPWGILTLIIYGLALSGAFVKVWGRDWTFTLSHFIRAFNIENGQFTGSAWASFFTTVKLAAISAPLTAILGLLAAWLLTRQSFKGKPALEFALMLSFCVPGTVIGVAYVLTFNVPPLELTGTGLILILSFMFRTLPVGVRSGMAALAQVDKSLDEASTMLKASTFRTITKILMPLLRPALISALIYSFVRAMTTVSAVIFLVSAKYELSTVFIINRSINGDYGLAIAASLALIVIMALALLLIDLLVGKRKIGRNA
jgi:iron(III) transport system permease protein